jgi:hypothetical protein
MSEQLAVTAIKHAIRGAQDATKSRKLQHRRTEQLFNGGARRCLSPQQSVDRTVRGIVQRYALTRRKSPALLCCVGERCTIAGNCCFLHGIFSNRRQRPGQLAGY